MFFGYKRNYSVSLMLAELNLPCFENFMSSNSQNFGKRWFLCSNNLVVNMNNMQL